MEIKEAEHVGSFPSEKLSPKDSKPEYAFIGRSNVGKSSLINMLCNRKDLAKVSNTPGKTQLLNFYLIDNSWFIVDLPGYGYAKISKKKRAEWEKMIVGYLTSRKNLGCAFVLIDANIPPQQIDIEFINWLGKMEVPFVIVFTKTDRLKAGEKSKNIKAFNDEMLKYWNELPQQFITSSSKSIGSDAILKFINEINKAYK